MHNFDLSWLFKPTDNLATLIYAAATLAGAIAVFSSVWRAGTQLRSEAASRRRAEIERQIDHFHSPRASAAIAILSNYDFDVDLMDGQGRQRISWPQVELALIPALFREHSYDKKEPAIRACFIELLQQLDRLHHLSAQGLIRESDVKHVAAGLIIRVSTGEANVFRNLRLFLLWYDARGAINLFRSYGHNLALLVESDADSLQQDIAAGHYGECVPSPWGRLPTPDDLNARWATQVTKPPMQ